MMQIAASGHGLMTMPVLLPPCTRVYSGVGAGVSGRGPTQKPWTGWPKPSSVFHTYRATDAMKRRGVIVRAAIQEQELEKEKNKPKIDVDETTRKMGLEAGLWQIFTSKDKSDAGSKSSKATQAKDLLTRYGGAYLATSISLSLISFGLCFVLINNGVDVSALLEKVGIHANETGEKVGTFALAYAAHKAASPIRFPPTVALTPIVATWFGKKAVDESEDQKE